MDPREVRPCVPRVPWNVFHCLVCKNIADICPNTNVRVLYIRMSGPVARYLGTICPGAGCLGNRYQGTKNQCGKLSNVAIFYFDEQVFCC